MQGNGARPGTRKPRRRRRGAGGVAGCPSGDVADPDDQPAHAQPDHLSRLVWQPGGSKHPPTIPPALPILRRACPTCTHAHTMPAP